MAKKKDSTVKAEKVRAFLVAHPEMTAQQIADKTGTTRGYVYNVKDRLRHEKNEAQPGAKAPELHQPEASAAAVVGGHVSTSVSGPLTIPGVRFVMVKRTHRPSAQVAAREPVGWQHDCGATGRGAAPATCPACGGA